MDFKNNAKRFYYAMRDFYTICKLFPNAVKMADSPTYFPEYNSRRKSRSKIVKDNIEHLIRYKEVNSFYMLYGLDIEGSDISCYIDYRSFMNTRNYLNRVGRPDGQIVLLRDKFLFHKYFSSNGIAVANTFAFIDEGKIVTIEMEKFDESDLKKREDYFIKSIDGECASFVKRIRNYEEFQKIYTKMDHSQRFILQESLMQCAELNRLNPGSLNTMRIVTIMKKGEVQILTTLLRVGTKKTGNVDNWAAGGIAVGIKSNGYLKEYGFYKPGFGQKIDRHPDTGVVFSEFEIPMFEKAKELVCNAHKRLYGIHSVGWDVAFTENGPIIIEGNDNWEISLQQACDRPLKVDWIDGINL